MKRIAVLVAVAALVCLTGCAARTGLTLSEGVSTLPPESKFVVGPVVDASGYVFPDAKETFSLSDAMTASLKEALGAYAQKPGQAGQAYVITTRITEYAPGNAFARWVMPGAGATKLRTESVVSTADHVEVARIPVEREVGFGGAYTVGEWKHVFDEVALLTVGVIKHKLLAQPGAQASSN